VILVGVAAAAGIAAAAAVVWAVALRDTAEPVSVDEVVDRYRARAASGDTAIPAGVYVYETSGEESISALGGTTHEYPLESTITVTPARCGMTLTWDALEERASAYTICDEGEELSLLEWTERHRFFGQDDRNDWRCDHVAWLPAEAEPGLELPYRCKSSDTLQAGTLTVVGTEPVVVGGTRLDALRVRIDATETGAARGTLAEERWLEPETGLPLRIVYRVETKNSSPIGDVTFEEGYELHLHSLEPRT
jgi:hypothetical protein